MEVQLEHIDVLAELERIGCKWESAGGDEVKCLCPAHLDSTPSCTINIRKRLWMCHAASCGARGDIVSFLAQLMSRVAKTTIHRSTVWADLTERYALDTEKTVDMEQVETAHGQLQKAGPLLGALYARGLTESLFRKYRIGFDGARITIPVFNKRGACVNIRKYLPGAPTAEKFKNVRGFGTPKLFPRYPDDQMAYEKIIVVGGECKAIVTALHMNPHGYGAICLTTGEGKDWNDEHVREFKNKRAFVQMDVDEGGRKATEIVCRRLAGVTTETHTSDLSVAMDAAKYPKGDQNDFFGEMGKTGEDMLALLAVAKKWTATPGQQELPQDTSTAPIKVHLSESTLSKHAGKRIALRAMVTAMDDTPYLVPRTVKCTCERNQKFCHVCPVFAKTPDDNGSVEMLISAETPTLLSMVKTGKSEQKDSIREALRMPRCKAVSMSIKELYNIEDARLVPQLEISSRASDRVMHPCYYVGKGLEINQAYDFECRVFAAPKSQQAVLLAYTAKPAEDALSQYRPSSEELQDLKIFQQEPGQTVAEKLGLIYADLSSNVTRIWKREELHLAMDLAYHSPLLLSIDNRTVKGWTEVLIVGDSSQGKSETAHYLMKHYGLGEKIECKNASVAGLLGGVIQIGNRYFVQWGVIPMHDKRLVVLEELKGAHTDVIAKLTDMRSSGVAEIPKIEKRRTHARTRLVAISNPRGNKPLKSFNFGIEAIVDLIGGLEDLRRFDLTIIVEKGQVDSAEINKLHKDTPQVEHVYTASLCRRLVLWAWTRTVGDVVFAEGSLERLIDRSLHLCEQFSEDVPIIDRGSMRYKLARLAAALAARLFSCSDDCQQLIVKPEHIDYVAQFIEKQYSTPEFGYKDYSSALKLAESILDPDEINKRVLSTPFPKDFIDAILYQQDIEARDIADWCSWDKDTAISMLAFLVRKHALTREKTGYRKTAAFISLLKQVQASDILKKVDRPSYLKEGAAKY